MPRKGRVDQKDVEKALTLAKELVSAKNQSGFSEISDSVTRKFGGAEGIANSLFLCFQGAKTWRQQKDILELVIKITSRNAEMTGSLDAFGAAISMLDDDELERAMLGISTRAIEIREQSKMKRSAIEASIHQEPLPEGVSGD